MKASDIAKVLRASKAVVEKGWCRGRFGFGTNNHCAVGAMMEDRDNYNGEILDAFCAAIGKYKLRTDNSKVEVIVHWNDAPGRTKQEVLDAFERAANIAEIDQDCQELKEVEHEQELVTA